MPLNYVIAEHPHGYRQLISMLCIDVRYGMSLHYLLGDEFIEIPKLLSTYMNVAAGFRAIILAYVSEHTCPCIFTVIIVDHKWTGDKCAVIEDVSLDRL